MEVGAIINLHNGVYQPGLAALADADGFAGDDSVKPGPDASVVAEGGSSSPSPLQACLHGVRSVARIPADEPSHAQKAVVVLCHERCEASDWTCSTSIVRSTVTPSASVSGSHLKEERNR